MEKENNGRIQISKLWIYPDTWKEMSRGGMLLLLLSQIWHIADPSKFKAGVSTVGFLYIISLGVDSVVAGLYYVS